MILLLEFFKKLLDLGILKDRYFGIQSQPGHPINIVNITNNEGIQNATRFAMSAYNNQTNDIFVFKVKRFNNATVQVVKGYKYVVEAVIGRTTCRKGKPFNFKDCPFQPKPPLNREFVCYYTVWSIPWEKKWILLSLKCQ
uniref:Cystatin-F n=1 Tax=Callorhinchus milii TaxID=7868 RepID=V9LFS1_CALMI|eukprot:gi/632953634/ref/XP_007892531.1/ PREDICTED: cystatin-F isoform X2 [Callorhinchus milii]